MRTITIRSIAIIVSLSVHLALLWRFGDVIIKAHSETKNQVLVTRLSLKRPPQPKIKSRQERKIVKSKPTPRPKPRPKPKIKPKPKPKPGPKPTPEPEPVVEPEPIVEKAPEPPAPKPPSAPAQAPEQVAEVEPPAVDVERIEQEKRMYLAMVIDKIEKNKYYPRAARRRGLQGNIKVTLTILDKGNVRHVKVRGGCGILRKAAEEAVRKSLPLPEPPDTVFCPLEVEYAMEFALR